jgi:hypothetical protein
MYLHITEADNLETAMKTNDSDILILETSFTGHLPAVAWILTLGTLLKWGDQTLEGLCSLQLCFVNRHLVVWIVFEVLCLC